VNRDVHAPFCIMRENSNATLNILLSHPGAVSGPKGLVVRQIMWYMI
jgi:hypothetical protein